MRVPPLSRRRPASTLRQLHLRATSSSGTASVFHAPAQPGSFFIPRCVCTGCKGSMFFSPALVWVGVGCLLLPALYWVGVRALGLSQQADAALGRPGWPTASATGCIGIWLPHWGFSRVFIYRNSGLHRSSWGLLPMLENLFLLTNFVLACSFFVLRTHICLMVLLSGGVCWSAPGRGTPALEEKRCRLGVVHFTPMLILRTASHEEKKGHCSSPRCIPDSIEKYLLPCPPILSYFSFLSLSLSISRSLPRRRRA